RLGERSRDASRTTSNHAQNDNQMPFFHRGACDDGTNVRPCEEWGLVYPISPAYACFRRLRLGCQGCNPGDPRREQPMAGGRDVSLSGICTHIDIMLIVCWM